MDNLFSACQPRPEILQDTFTVGLFTADVRPVVNAYRGITGDVIDRVYTDPELFFTQATYPTQGMRQVVEGVCRRLSGLGSDAIYRLDTAFGGGKTHILIALTHIAYGNRDVLRSSTSAIVDPSFIPSEPVSLAVIDGSKISVECPNGKGGMSKHPLWAELAEQLTGGNLGPLLPYCQSQSPPGEEFFKLLFPEGTKSLILMDELAHYAMRLEAGAPGRAETELASFLKSLTDDIDKRPGVALVATFASDINAFGSQNVDLKKLFMQGSGQEKASDSEVAAARAAGFRPVKSVLDRYVSGGVTPVQPGEISSLLAKRLFNYIDPTAAYSVAQSYMDYYQRASGDLPDTTTTDAYRKRIELSYPFHPSFIDFINEKLAAAPDFQGTRGILRVLSLAIRSLWRNPNTSTVRAPCIHVTDLDLKDTKVHDQMVPSKFANALTVDVGGPRTGAADKLSRAAFRDQENPHPLGIPMHELVWRAVFLNSMTSGQAFGITDQEAAQQVGFPGLDPSQISAALSAIEKHAWYLKSIDGKYFAKSQANLNQVIEEKAADLAMRIDIDPASKAIEEIAQKLVKVEKPFRVVSQVSGPEDIEDSACITLAIMQPRLEGWTPKDIFVSTGYGQARKYQNAIILLATPPIDDTGKQKWREIESDARQLVVMQDLAENPGHYGIDEADVHAVEFMDRLRKSGIALQQRVSGCFSQMWFTQAMTGDIISHPIAIAPSVNVASILKSLRDSSDLLSVPLAKATAFQVLQSLCRKMPNPSDLDAVMTRFRSDRELPMIEDDAALVQLVTIGVQEGHLALYRKPATPELTPDTIVWKDALFVLDMPAISGAFKEWGIVPIQMARRLGWIGEKPLSNEEVMKFIIGSVGNADKTLQLSSHRSCVIRDNPRVSDTAFDEAFESCVKREQILLFEDNLPTPDISAAVPAGEWPLRGGNSWLFTPSQCQQEKKAVVVRQESRALTTNDWDVLVSVARSIGSLYFSKGAKSVISELIMHVNAGGATVGTTLTDVSVDNWKHIKDVVNTLLDFDDGKGDAYGTLKIDNPVEGCPLAKMVRNAVVGV
jgi:Protein of unknown function (DUF499)